MSSNTSPWTAFTSPERGSHEPGGGERGSPLRTWQTAIAFPILVAILIASAAAPLIHLFLNPSFGLTDGRPAPFMAGFAAVGLVGCWSAQWLSPRIRGKVAWTIVSAALWTATFTLWMLVQPHYDMGALLRHPGSLVGTEGYFVVPIFLSLGAWWVGARYGFDTARFVPEEIRGLVQRCWLVLIGSIVLAAIVHGEPGQAAIDAARLGVPLCMIASVALVAGTEVEATRRLARRRGGDVPGWSRWYRLSGGFALAILLLSVVVLGVLSPGTMRTILDLIQTGLRGIGWVLGYVLFAIVYVFYIVIRAVSTVLEWLFGDIFGPMEPPKMEQQSAPPGELKLPEQQQTGPWEYAMLLRWIAIGIAIIVVGIVILRMTRRARPDDEAGAVDEERESVFSGDLAKRQLRDLFRRAPAPPATTRLDLDRAPATARDAMRYLEVLANREGVGRREDETSLDFVARLRADWAGTGGPLGDLLTAYQPVRYGDLPDEPGDEFGASAANAWSAIWSVRKRALEATSGDRSRGRRSGNRT